MKPIHLKTVCIESPGIVRTWEWSPIRFRHSRCIFIGGVYD